MFYTIKMYFDEYPDLSNPQNILDVFDIIGDAIEEKYDLINYLLFDPDSDRILINRNYKYNDRGLNRFLNTTIEPIVIGEDDFQSSPFLTAETKHSDNEFFSKIGVTIFYPVLKSPALKITVHYDCGDKSCISLKEYASLINKLNELGFRLNNSFVHVYGRKDVSQSIDIGGLYYLKHLPANRLNCIIGVYCADSIRSECLDEATKKEIERIVGSDNVINDNGMFYFSLGKLEKMNPFYRIMYMDRIMKIKKLMK